VNAAWDSIQASGYLSEDTSPQPPGVLAALGQMLDPLEEKYKRVCAVVKRARDLISDSEASICKYLRTLLKLVRAAREPKGSYDGEVVSRGAAMGCVLALKQRLHAKALEPIRRAMLATADVLFSTLCSSGSTTVQEGLMASVPFVDLLIVDEAGQATEVRDTLKSYHPVCSQVACMIRHVSQLESQVKPPATGQRDC
jgi:hypothetical protein